MCEASRERCNRRRLSRTIAARCKDHPPPTSVTISMRVAVVKMMIGVLALRHDFAIHFDGARGTIELPLAQQVGDAAVRRGRTIVSPLRWIVGIE